MGANTYKPPLKNEAIRRLQAREDFIKLGDGRSVRKLLEKYIADAKRDPDNAHMIPTRSKEQIYLWSKEDNWDVHATNRDMENELMALHDMSDVTRKGRQQLANLVPEAISALAQILQTGADKDRLVAIQRVFERVGLNEINLEKVADKTGNPSLSTTAAPDVSASPEEKIRYLSDAARQQAQA